MTEKDYIKSIFKALDVLEYLGKNVEEKGCLEIAHDLKIPPATTHRILSTLAARGYVRQNPSSGDYQLGAKILDLKDSLECTLDIKKVAQPYMSKLVEVSRESCNLGVLDGAEVLHIRRIESPEVIRANIRSFRLPAHTSALGKVLLAFNSKSQVEKMLPQKLPRLTENSKTSIDELFNEFAQIRERGYSIDDEEGFIGVRSVAVPIFNHSGKVIAGISLVGPVKRMSYEKLEECKNLLVVAAHSISKEMGYHKKE